MGKKFEKKLIIAMPKDLFEDFQKICEEEYTTMSQEIRNFMLKFIKEHKYGKNNND